MKKHTEWNLAILLGLVILVNAGTLLLYRSRNLSGYAASIVEKQQMLESSSPPRIILVGGSNVAFGFNSATIQQRTGLSVINMGLYVQLGLPYLLAEIKPFVGPGDIVVLSPEYGDLLTPNPYEKYSYLQTLILFPRSIQFYPSFITLMTIPECLPAVHTQAIQTLIDDLIHKGCVYCEPEEDDYIRYGFNSFGDYIDHLTKKPSFTRSEFEITITSFSPQTANMVKAMNAFAAFAETKGASVYLSYPSLMIPDYSKSERAFSLLHRYLSNNLQFKILDTPQSQVYESSDMYDSFYHLNAKGRELRTQKILDSLCDVLPGSCK